MNTIEDIRKKYSYILLSLLLLLLLTHFLQLVSYTYLVTKASTKSN